MATRAPSDVLGRVETLDLSSFNVVMWLIAILAAVFIGIAKGGVGGVSMFALVLFAYIMPSKLSVGAVLPLLIAGDVLAVWFYRKNAVLHHVWGLLPPTMIGVAIGAILLHYIPSTVFKPFIGVLILVLIGLQIWRGRTAPAKAAAVPVDPATPAPAPPVASHGPLFSWSMGFLAGVTTMLGNAAGAVMTIYLLSMRLAKAEFVGTGAVFFFIINVAKTPFSAAAGALTWETLRLNVFLVPAVWAGFFLGKFVLARMSQKFFEVWMLAATALAAVVLIFKH